MKLSPMLSTLLEKRGITSEDETQAFLSPDYVSHSHDPFLLRDMEKAVERLYKAIKNKEKIVIWSDYDADGIPGAVILRDLMKKIGANNFENYIPHRHNEGFGLNKEAMDEFKKDDVKLIITIDCGIGDSVEVNHANSFGIDVIITDHHEPNSKIPEAFAIINPKMRDCAYPEKILCGSGVIFKFVQAFLKKYGKEFGVKEGWEKWLLDMVGIATLSDMVPLTGENRTFAYYGLKVLRKTVRPGLSQLFLKLRIKRDHLTEDDINFSVTPRLNAASRMGEPDTAFNLLSTDDISLAGAYADALEHVNNERKGSVAALVKEIRKVMSERDMASKKIIVLGNPTWRPSLLGLVANSLAEEYSKPVFLWGRDGGGVIKGSCRSGGSCNVLELMQRTAKSFLDFGGHGASGGFEVSKEKIHNLADALEIAASEFVNENQKKESLIDVQISLDEVSWTLYKDMEKLSPFGMGNPKPVFLIKRARVHSIRAFGKENNHTELILADNSDRKISAVKFFSSVSALSSDVVSGAVCDLVAHLEKSVWKSSPELRLRIIDILKA